MRYQKFKAGQTAGTYVMEGEDASEDEILAMAGQLSRDRLSRGRVLTSPDRTKAYLQNVMQGYEREVFVVLMFDARQRVIGFEELFKGTLSTSVVYPREVVKCVLKNNAAAIIVAHNHPSGDPSPSEADIQLTGKLKQALAMVDVRLLDHIVVGRGSTVSLLEEGQI